MEWLDFCLIAASHEVPPLRSLVLVVLVRGSEAAHCCWELVKVLDHSFFLWCLAGVELLPKHFVLLGYLLQFLGEGELAFVGNFLSVPFGLSGLLVSLASNLVYIRQKQNFTLFLSLRPEGP